MAQDPKIIYKTNDPKVQKILNTANGTNMTPNVSEVEAKQVRDKYDATSPKHTMVNDSTTVKPNKYVTPKPLTMPNLLRSVIDNNIPRSSLKGASIIMKKIKNFFNN